MLKAILVNINYWSFFLIINFQFTIIVGKYKLLKSSGHQIGNWLQQGVEVFFNLQFVSVRNIN